MKKKIVLLGATGSIGRQTLDVLRQHPDQFELVGISAGHQEKELADIAAEFQSVKAAALPEFRDPQAFKGVQLFEGPDAMADLTAALDYDLLVNATVGFRGLKPTLAAVDRGIDVALANKESLVAGGPLVNEALKKSGARLYPIDSEHSAIYQCLLGNDKRQVRRLIITASGGSLRNLKRDELNGLTPERVLQHPNWNMGQRITVDSATMVNKGFEVIEAHYLFGLDYDQIDTVLHDESIVHSMVEYTDHAIMAQLGSADMRLPIQFALLDGRMPLKEEHPLDMTQTMNLHFRKMDFERFPMLKTAYEAGRKGGNQGAVFNGADEQAVALFLKGEIEFLDIEKAILHALNTVEYMPEPTLEQLEASDRQAREAVCRWAAGRR